MKSTALWIKLLGMIGISFVASHAFAEISQPDGWYVSGNIGTPHTVEKSQAGSSSIRGLGLNGNFGYKFMPYLGAEMGYSWYGETSIKDQYGVKAFTQKHHAYDLALKGMLPLEATGFEFFAKLGVERLTENLKTESATAAANISPAPSGHTSTGVLMGVGGEYYFTPMFAASLNWQRSKGGSSTGTYDLYSLGLVYIVG